MKILIVGPSFTKSKGGMATVIKGIKDSKILNEQFNIDIFESYVDGTLIKRFLYSIFAYLRFFFSI